MINLKLIDAALAAYDDDIDTADAQRLQLFHSFWELQAAAMVVSNDEYEVSAAQIKEALQAQCPVFSMAPVTVDFEALALLTGQLAESLVESGVFPAEVVRALERVKWDRVLKASKIERAGSDPSAWISYLCEVLTDDGMDAIQAQLAALLASMALRAQLDGPAARVMATCKHETIALGSSLVCPVCGTAPMMAHVGAASAAAEGGRVLVCGQCGVVWDYERVRCARCGQRDQTKLHFYNIEGDDAHRIATCDTCGGYIRTLYSQNSLAPCSYEVEDVLMARLDAIALDPQLAQGEQED